VPTAVPQFIKDMKGYHETKYQYGDGYIADWSFPYLEEFTIQFFTDVAERYDNDPRVAFFQTGFGLWGEYHLDEQEEEYGKTFPSYDFQARFLKHLDKVFVETPISISIDAAKHSPITSDKSLLDLKFGIFDDTFLMKKHDEWQCKKKCGYNERNWKALDYTSRFLRAPHGGEIAVPEQKEFLRPEGVNGTTFEESASKYHITYMLAGGVQKGVSGTPERVAAASIHTGYSLVVTGVTVSNTVACVNVKNVGIAPVYHSFYVTVNGIRSSKSLKFLAPEETESYYVSGLKIYENRLKDIKLTITSDKLYDGQVVPYDAEVVVKFDRDLTDISGSDRVMINTILLIVLLTIFLVR